ncbi:type I polyketide synthase, partial [Actinomadura craniellae]
LTQNLTTTDHTRLANLGITPLTTHQATTTLTHTLTHHTHPHLAITNLAQQRQADPRLLSPLLRHLFGKHAAIRPAAANGSRANGRPSLPQQLAGLPASDQVQLLLKAVRDQVAAVLGHGSIDKIDPLRGFLDLGLDSLTAVELRNRLNAITGLQLTTTAVFDHPTPADLAQYLHARLAPSEPGGYEVVLAEIGKLESTLQKISEADRVVLTSRLHDVLLKLNGTHERDLAEEESSSILTARIESASDEEVFNIIDNELGI